MYKYDYTNEQFFLDKYNLIKELFKKHNIEEALLKIHSINYGLFLKAESYKKVDSFMNSLVELCNKLEIVNTITVIDSVKSNPGKYRFEDYVLLVAAKYGDLDMVQTTISNGADPKAVIEGLTAYDWAKKKDHQNILEYFDQLNTQQDTPMAEVTASDGNETNFNTFSIDENIPEPPGSADRTIEKAYRNNVKKHPLSNTIGEIKAEYAKKKLKSEILDNEKSDGKYR